MCDNASLIKFLTVPDNIRRCLLFSIGMEHLPIFEEISDCSIDYVQLIHWLQQQIEVNHSHDVKSISSQLISSRKCAELYESLCKEILLSKDNSRKLVFHTVTLLTVLRNIVTSRRAGTRENSHVMINILCSTLKRAHNFVSLRRVVTHSLVAVGTIILVCAFLGHGD
jgi:hypothetical protein